MKTLLWLLVSLICYPFYWLVVEVWDEKIKPFLTRAKRRI